METAATDAHRSPRIKLQFCRLYKFLVLLDYQIWSAEMEDISMYQVHPFGSWIPQRTKRFRLMTVDWHSVSEVKDYTFRHFPAICSGDAPEELHLLAEDPAERKKKTRYIYTFFNTQILFRHQRTLAGGRMLIGILYLSLFTGERSQSIAASTSSREHFSTSVVRATFISCAHGLARISSIPLLILLKITNLITVPFLDSLY